MTAATPLEQLVKRAVQRRSSLEHAGATTAYRLLNGVGDGLPGITADRYGEVVVVNVYDLGSASADALVAALAGATGVRAVYVKRRPRSATRLSTAQVAALAPRRRHGARRSTRSSCGSMGCVSSSVRALG